MNLPPISDLLSGAMVVSLPLRTGFRGVNQREVMLIEGPYGWAEFSPFLEYPDAEASRWLQAGIEFAWAPPPPQYRDQITVNATVPAVSAAEVPEILARFKGCTTAKIKVAEAGQSLNDDIARVSAVREIMGAEAQIRIDANGAWSVDEAITALDALKQYRLEYVEQPCSSIIELAQLRLWSKPRGIKIAADESIRKVEDPLAVARAGAADLIVIKAQPLGGVRRAIQIVTATGLAPVVSSALDSSIGISMGLALAASLPQLNHACGLGTVSLLSQDVCAEPLRPAAGILEVKRVSPDASTAASLKVPSERKKWWLARAERCYDILRAQSS